MENSESSKKAFIYDRFHYNTPKGKNGLFSQYHKMHATVTGYALYIFVLSRWKVKENRYNNTHFLRNIEKQCGKTDTFVPSCRFLVMSTFFHLLNFDF